MEILVGKGRTKQTLSKGLRDPPRVFGLHFENCWSSTCPSSRYAHIHGFIWFPSPPCEEVGCHVYKDEKTGSERLSDSQSPLTGSERVWFKNGLWLLVWHFIHSFIHIFFFETGSCCHPGWSGANSAHCSLDLLGSHNPSASASCVAGTTGVHHHT